MSFPSGIQEFLDNNKAFAETYQTPPEMKHIRVAARESGQLTLILACMDPRSVPEKFFGPNITSAVMRNAGGRVTRDAITHMLVLRSLADLKNVIVVHHTDCGLTHMTDEQIAREAKDRTPDAVEDIEGRTFGCFTANEFEETIKKDVISLRNTKALAGMNIYGMALDTETGVVKPLDI